MSTCCVIFSFEPRPEAYVSGPAAEQPPPGALVATLSPDEGRRIFGVDRLPDARTPLARFLGPVALGLLERLAARAAGAGRAALLEAFIDARRAVTDADLADDAAFELEALSCFTPCPARLFEGWVGMSATRFSRLVEEKDMSARSRCAELLSRSCSPAFSRPAAEETSSSVAWPPAFPARRS